MIEYIKNNKYFAQVAGTVEKYAVKELEAFGADVIQEVPRGVRFSCDQETLYKILYCSRLIQRVLAPIISYNCHSEKYLYSQAFKNVQWTELFDVDDTFSIISNVSNSKIKHSLYASQVLKDAICDQFRMKYDIRPNFSQKEADIVFSLHIQENWATISLDIIGKSLHKRGYRNGFHTAPMQETLAAAIINITEWNGQRPLYDVMCGSGTILAEALMVACHIPAGYLRDNSAVAYLPDYNEELWNKVKSEADSQIIPLKKDLIFGSDKDAESIEFAKDNLKVLPYGENVKFSIKRFQDYKKLNPCTIITNPPYGIRLGDQNSTIKLYQDLGDFLKQKCPDSTAYILCGSVELVSALRLRATWKKTLKNADIETKLAKIVMK